MIGEKLSDIIQNDWLPKETNIQKLTRVRKAIDWLYQDPEHVSKTRENSTALNISTLIAHSSVELPRKTPSAEMIHVLHSLNMSALHEHSQQFKYSAIGDVGTILWGTLSNTKTIDFKSKLAENANTTALNKTNTNKMKPKIIKRKQKLNDAGPILNVTEQTAMAVECKVAENNVSLIDTIKTTLSTTEIFLDSTESAQKAIMNETRTDETNSFKRIDRTPSTSSLGDKRFIYGASNLTTDHLSDSMATSDLKTQIIGTVFDNSSTIKIDT